MTNIRKIMLLSIILFAFLVKAQDVSNLQQANREFDLRNYAKAVAAYEPLLNDSQISTNQRRQVKTNMAYAYVQLGDNAKAEKLYNEVINEAPFNGFMISHYLHFAKALANLGKAKESQAMLETYEAAKKEENKGMANSSMNNSTKKVSYKLTSLPSNTDNAEFSPMFYKDGLVYLAGNSSVSDEGVKKGYLDLYYLANRDDLVASSNAKGASSNNNGYDKAPRNLGSDAYTRPTSNDSKTLGTYSTYGANSNTGDVAEAAGGKLGKPVSFSKILNTKYHEGPATFSKDGSTIIFTRNNFNAGKKGESSENDIKLKLYSAQKGNLDWENVQELPFNSDEYSTAHPALSADGKKLYFVSDMPGGVGGKDLYVSRLEGNQWTTPVNLGKEINTRNDEVFPFCDDNGNLYFSTSGRRGGLGGLDIYYAILSGDGTKIIDILPLEAPINSKGDDFGFITDAARSNGFMSSNRDGDDDIYHFVRESSFSDCRELTLRVFNNATASGIDSAQILVKTKGSNEVMKEIYTDEFGRAHLCLASDNDFIFTVNKDGLLPSTVGFSTRGLTDDKATRFEMVLNEPTKIEYAENPKNTNDSVVETNVADDKLENGKEPTKGGDTSTTNKNSTKKNIEIRSVMTLRGISRDSKDEPISEATVKLINPCSGQVIKTMQSNTNGFYEFKNVLMEDCGFDVKVSKERYSTSVARILPKTIANKKSTKVISTNFTLFKEGENITLDKINFDNKNTTLSPEAMRELNRMATMLGKYTNIKADLIAHTDSRGDAEQNRLLTQKRAQAAVDYLVKKGVSRNRLKAVGMGESQPINECVDGVKCTELEYQRNRRMELIITSTN